MAAAPLDIADYMARVYEAPPCWNLTADVYASHLGEDVRAYKTVSNGVRAIARAFRIALHKADHGFVKLAEPVDYAVVLMGEAPSLGLHHCGVYYAGSVLHATDDGTYYQDMNTLRAAYPLMEFWGRQ